VCIQVDVPQIGGVVRAECEHRNSKVCIQFALFACEVLKTKGVYSVDPVRA